MNRTSLRALAAILAVAVVSIALAACGSSGSSGVDGKSPLDKALHYAPKNTPFVATFQTDPNGSQVKNAQAILKKFPFSGQVTRGFKQALQNRKVDFDKDIKPILGNEFMASATNVRSFLNNDNSNRNFVGAIQVKDKDKLTKALDKEKPKDLGKTEGQTLYQSDDTFYAVDDDVLVVAGAKGDLEAAIKDARSDNHFSEAAYDKGTDGLPKDAFLRTYFDVKALLDASPNSAQARKIKWVDALRSFGLTAGVKSDSIDVNFKLGTDSSGLSADDLPIASGAESPQVIKREGQVGFGIRGLDQIFKFAESAGQAAAPDQFSSYETAKSTIEKQLNINIDQDIVSQLSGDLSSTSGTDGRSAAKIKLDDPAAFEKTLAKLNKAIPSLAGGSSGGAPTTVKKTGNLFTLTSRGTTIVYGVEGDSFVIAQTAADAKGAASAPATPVDGAKGAIAFDTNAEQLVQAAIRRFSSASSSLSGITGALGTSLFTGPLGELTGSIESETDGITGKVSLGFD